VRQCVRQLMETHANESLLFVDINAVALDDPRLAYTLLFVLACSLSPTFLHNLINNRWRRICEFDNAPTSSTIGEGSFFFCKSTLRGIVHFSISQ
jgi:hypothetical protein